MTAAANSASRATSIGCFVTGPHPHHQSCPWRVRDAPSWNVHRAATCRHPITLLTARASASRSTIGPDPYLHQKTDGGPVLGQTRNPCRSVKLPPAGLRTRHPAGDTPDASERR